MPWNAHAAFSSAVADHNRPGKAAVPARKLQGAGTLAARVASANVWLQHAEGKVVFVDAIARRLPIQMISKLLGVPDRDAEELFHWADSVGYHADPDFSDVLYD